jgi:hypothetical protein
MGILISSFDYSPVAEDEFHDWYDTEHIPERERIPGFLQCTRWLAAGESKVSLNTYELASIDVLRSPGYLAVGYDNNSPWTRRVGWRCIKRLRFEGVQAAPGARLPPERSGGLLVVAMNAAPECDAALTRALDDELLPQLGRVPGVACVRRFRATKSSHQHLLICHLDGPAIADSASWRHAGGDFLEVQQRWQVRDFSRTLCVLYHRAQIDARVRPPWL